MASGADEIARGLQLVTTSMVDAAMRLAILLIERRAERLRQAAREGERRARQERARMAAHRAADAAIWRRTADPVFWRWATPEQVARAWQAVSTWHQADPEAAGARHAIAERLRRRGVDVVTDVTADPGDALWLQTALALAEAEREEMAAFTAELDSDLAEHLEHILWNEDEVPRPVPQAESADQVLWNHDELSADEVRAREALIADEVMWQPDEAARKGDQTKAGDCAEGRATQAQADGSPSGLRKGKASRGRDVPAPGAAALPRVKDASETDTPGPAGQGKIIDVGDDAIVHSHHSEPGSAGGQTAQDGTQPSAQQAEGAAPNAAAARARGIAEHEQSRMEGMLRQAWPADNANRVLDDEAWPVLARSMVRLDREGKDVPGLLGKLPYDTTDAKVSALTHIPI